MTFIEIVIALALPPLAVAMHRKATKQQVGMTFILWLLGWFPGVIYALRVVTAAPEDLPASAANSDRESLIRD